MKANNSLPGGQVPVYVDEQGRYLNQTGALLIMLGKKHNLYQKDLKGGYEDDWAVENFSDIWKPDFYRKWFAEELDSETITVCQESFTKWNEVVEKKLQSLNTKFIGGDKPSVGDFITFAIYADFVLNQNTKVPDLRNSLRAEMLATPKVQEWVKNM